MILPTESSPANLLRSKVPLNVAMLGRIGPEEEAQDFSYITEIRSSSKKEKSGEWKSVYFK